MLFRFQDGDVLVAARIGKRSLLANEQEIDALRLRIGDCERSITSLRRFVTRSAVADELPAAFLMYRSDVLYGVALIAFRRKHGIPSGVASAADGTGQGGVIAAPADRIGVLETASRALMRIPFVHTVVLSTLWPERPCGNDDYPTKATGGRWHFRDVAFRLDMSGGAKATMERLGYKMRRNLGYYRRRAETMLGCRFLPELRPEQQLEAVEALFDKGTYQVSVQNARRLDATLRTLPGSFAMGLQDGDGVWLSYLAGWRSADGTYVEWQLNREHPTNASFSTVLRSYMLQQELERGSPAINFVGGTTPHWSRACVPAVCGDLLVVRKGLFGDVARHMVRRFSPSGRVAELHGKPVP